MRTWRAWTAAEERTLLEMTRAGKRHDLVAEALGRTVSSTKGRLNWIRFHGEMESNDNEAARRCLSCEEEFHSKWIGHRICDACKDTDVWRSGAA